MIVMPAFCRSSTKNAWVQSYGTRCVKPPIVWGDVSRAQPITVAWVELRIAHVRVDLRGRFHRGVHQAERRHRPVGTRSRAPTSR